ncbi:MAG: phosphate acyltransferase PlsX [Clostridia bacterium]|nr:phosphate acyltransferase PlsX [Clostridia bacterium]
MKLIIDAMGGDNAPCEIIKGTVEKLNIRDDFSVIFVGPEDTVKEELKKYTYPSERVEIVNATEVIGMEEHPVEAIKKKKDSSMVVGQLLLKEGKADAFVTCGSTGACLACAQLRLGRIKGINRPALAPVLPNGNKGVMLIDSGANMDCKPINLAQFAVMGSIYMSKVLGIEDPRVGLANVGTEDTKGNELAKASFQLIKEQNLVNFIGNAEGRDICDKVDVMVADGFSGNLVLKSMEGFASFMVGTMKKSFKASVIRILGAMLLKPAIKDLKKAMDHNAYGGAPLLGVDGVVIKGHGSSKANTMHATIDQAIKMVQADIVGIIKENIPKMTVNE